MEQNVDSRALLMAAAVQRGAVGSTVASKIDGYLADCAELGRPVDVDEFVAYCGEG